MSSRTCPTCSTSVPAGQRFCSNCGTDMASGRPAGQANQYGGPPPQAFQFPQGQPPQPIPPYVQSPYEQQPQPIPSYQQPQQKSNPIMEAFGALGLLFLLRRYLPGYQARDQSSGCCGCLTTLFIVAIFLGIPAFFVYNSLGPNTLQKIYHASTSSTGSIPATQPPITTTEINQTVNYAGVDITVVMVQQSVAFIDDNSSTTSGMIRMKLKESAGSKVGAFLYSDSVRLILPDKITVAPVSEQNNISPQAGTTRTNQLDFPVSTTIKINQLTLQLGTDKEAQIDLPLTGKADLSAFNPKTAKPNASTQYHGLTWTVTTATLSFSADGRQAPQGMRYVVVTLKIDNPSERIFSAYWGDYARLKAGDATSAPTTDSTLPTSFPGNSSGTTGTLIFQVPAGATSASLILLAQPEAAPPVNQSAIDFQL